MMVLPDRQVVGFALCGVLLDMTFVILLSAARDLIVDSSLPTSAVLAAAILPLWALKVAAPWFVDRGSYMFKVTAASLVGVASLCATALLPNVYMKLVFGVATGAVATALGEVTFFALVSRYPKRCVLALTAGTGLCGLCGSGLYYCFTEILQLSTKSTLLFASCLPLTLVFAFAEFLRPVPAMLDETVEELVVEDPVLGQVEYEDSALLKKEESERIAAGRRTRSTGLQMSVKLDFVRTQLLVDYMIPLFTIFFCGYLINQGVVPVITFDSPWTSTRGQYPLFLFVANIGGLLARASPLVFEVECLHALAFSVVGILAALIVHAYHSFIPNLTSFLALAFVEGALGGLVFVNAFRLINKHVTDERLREFGMGVVSVADATGVVFAAGVGLVLEPALARAQLG